MNKIETLFLAYKQMEEEEREGKSEWMKKRMNDNINSTYNIDLNYTHLKHLNLLIMLKQSSKFKVCEYLS